MKISLMKANVGSYKAVQKQSVKKNNQKVTNTKPIKTNLGLNFDIHYLTTRKFNKTVKHHCLRITVLKHFVG